MARPQGLDIHLIPGDITVEITDSIVHPTNPQIDNAGEIGQALLAVAGSGYKDECARNQISDVVCTTGSGNLPCKYVIHVNVHASNSYAEKYEACLMAADKLGCTSIAVPAIGTGKAGKTSGDIAKAFTQGVQQFLLKRNRLEVIRLIIYRRELVADFDNALLEIVEFMQKNRPRETFQFGMLPVLSKDGSEYKTTERRFLSEMTTAVEVIEIQKVQNKSLESAYSSAMQAMQRQGKPLNEMQVWHGTGAENVNSIWRTGLQMSKVGKHGTAYGQGAYFASNAQTSLNYASPDGSKRRRMFLCKILAGKYTTGQSGHSAPPHPYDSLVDNDSNPGIFVIFQEDRIMPLYLVTFIVK